MIATCCGAAVTGLLQLRATYLKGGGAMPDHPSSRKQSRIPAQDVRSEQRISVNEPVQLSSMHQPSVTESTRTQDISPHGARVITHQIWQPGGSLLISSLRSDFWAEARVVYLRSFASSTFAIGLEFLIRARNVNQPSVKNRMVFKTLNSSRRTAVQGCAILCSDRSSECLTFRSMPSDP